MKGGHPIGTVLLAETILIINQNNFLASKLPPEAITYITYNAEDCN
jgi:hypothetical protein